MTSETVEQYRSTAIRVGDWVIVALCDLALGDDPGDAVLQLPEETGGRWGPSTSREQAREDLSDLLGLDQAAG